MRSSAKVELQMGRTSSMDLVSTNWVVIGIFSIIATDSGYSKGGGNNQM